jgi:starch-binding outer membrane protein, SusD/RagB family
MKPAIFRSFLFILVFFCISSCKKLISVGPPPSQLTSGKVFLDSATAVAALGNIYSIFDQNISGNYSPDISMYADELYSATTPDILEFSNSAVSVSNSANLNNWKNFYAVIYQANAVIENTTGSATLSPGLANQLTGEAEFLRADAYFYLISLFGDVPLLTSTDVTVTAIAERTDTSVIYNQILHDLLDAQKRLPAGYPTAERCRANLYAIDALLAKVYLFEGNYTAAQAQASAVLGSGIYSLDSLNAVFGKTSTETILQFWNQNGFTQPAALYISSGVPDYTLTDSLMNSFETGDNRAIYWTAFSGGAYYPFKYKNAVYTTGTGAEYFIGFRLAEQYLIRAEAEINQGSLAAAAADINAIRNRAGLPPVTASTADSLSAVLMHERRVELFTEWGDRFLDLKRTGQLQHIMAAYKPATWKPTAALLPVPFYETSNDPNLSQNPGY